MTLSVELPLVTGGLEEYTLKGGPVYPTSSLPASSRVVYAAAHVVAGDGADLPPGAPTTLNWDLTLAFRHHLWDLGLGVAEAMDTAQRGMGLDWPLAGELVRRTGAEARSRGAALVAGAQTDHLAPGTARTIEEIRVSYLEQCEAIEAAGARVVLMASRELCRVAKGSEDYAKVYGPVLSQLREPAILHWLSEMFDPQLRGYWGSENYAEASTCILGIIADNVGKVDGVKLSVLDQAKEVDLRGRLPLGVRMYTGDDFDYPTTMAGDGFRHSDALLGAFDYAAPAAAWSMQALDQGDTNEFVRRLAPTLPLSRHVFARPTSYYKTGVVFLAYLNGYQPQFRMMGGMETSRSLAHLAQCFRLADVAGLLPDAQLAVARMRQLLASAGS